MIPVLTWPAPNRLAYVDTSAVMAIALEEPGWEALDPRLSAFTRLVSSNLLEAETRSALHREGRPFAPRILTGIEWVFPDRPLSPEIAMVLSAGYLRGAGLWHIATALYFAPTPGGLTFLTLDNRQSEAAALGFQE